MLIDCSKYPESELLIVEGKHAANALKRVRNYRDQAIIALQGKLPNAKSVSEARLLENPQIANLLGAIDVQSLGRFQFNEIRYCRLIIFTDPDADGLHARLLVVLLFLRHMRFIIEQERVYVGYTPLYSIDSPHLKTPVLAYTGSQYKRALADLESQGISDAVTTRYKGLAGMDLQTLNRCCINTDSRMVRLVTVADCEAMLKPFGSV